MKVTVCFGPVRVVVPCGDGDILVKDLTRQAIHRYKKAVGKGGGVVVHSLQSADGGILDPDDRLHDVADDREHLVAAFQHGSGNDDVIIRQPLQLQHPQHHHQQRLHQHGDGASNSSRGTPSPDGCSQLYAPVGNGHVNGGGGNDIEVTLEQQTSHVAGLQVRRGSEPALNQLLANDTAAGAGGASHDGNGRTAPNSNNVNSKRWSAAPLITESHHNNHNNEDRELRALSNGHSTDKWRDMDEEEEEDDDDLDVDLEDELLGGGGGRNGWGGAALLRPGGGQPFARDGSNRLSMQFLGDSPSGVRWADAADKAYTRGVHSLSLPRESRTRKEPLGQANPPENDYHERTELIVVSTGGGALGIHVVPDYDAATGRERGLLVQAVEAGGRIHTDNRLHQGDRILHINGRSLIGQPFHVVQDIFRESLRSSELRLRVVKQQQQHQYNSSTATAKTAPTVTGKKPPPPVYPKPPAPHSTTVGARLTGNSADGGSGNKENYSGDAAHARKKGTGGGGVVVGGGQLLQSGNTRRIGRKIEVRLVKGAHGLGFSITTRDNPAGGNCPIYIKNILPKGAAVEDGRLRPGDRLLAVDGVELTGKSQAEAVALLRQVPANATVTICVSRHDSNSNNSGGNHDNQTTAANEANPTTASPNKRAGDAKTPHSKSINNNNNNSASSNQEASSPGKNSRSSDGNQSKSTTNTNANYAFKQAKEDELTSSASSPPPPPPLPTPPHSPSPSTALHQWKQREILTLYIPVHDTEKAGLGVSVKGKTTATTTNSSAASTDLGIFIKNVLHGGAASRDGRLRTNDQLLSVNGISLAGLSNQAAMQTLRRAMLLQHNGSGTILLTVARRITTAASSSAAAAAANSSSELQQQRRGSVSSLLTDSSANTETFGAGSSREHSSGQETNLSGNSEHSDTTVICLPSPPQRSNDGVLMRNAVLERLTGQSSLPGMGNLHNESYYRATHQTTLLSLGDGNGKQLMTSPTVNQPGRETVIIEEDNTSFVPSTASGGAANGVPGGGGGGSARSSVTSSMVEGGGGGADATYASQLSLDTTTTATTNGGGGDAAGGGGGGGGFSRDAFGRQSMSEKRHATLDAKNTDTYRRNKRAREMRNAHAQSSTDLPHRTTAQIVRINSAESLARSDCDSADVRDRGQVGPSLGMKKSSSLESLQTMVQELQMAEDRGMGAAAAVTGAASRVVVRGGRGCNESFRAAVDRSYDCETEAALQPLQPLDTLNEDEGGGGIGLGVGVVAGAAGMIGRRQTSLDSKLKAAKKRQSLLRGIGSMFRFGKHRKSADGNEEGVEGGEGGEDDEEMVGGGGGGGGGDRELARRMARDEQERIQEQYRRLMVREANSQHMGSGSGSGSGRESGVDVPPVSEHSPPTTANSSTNRVERIQQLRAQHQLRHAERHGHYPLEDTEERYELALRQRLEQSPADVPLPQMDAAMHRPGSRVAISAAPDPSARFSHYVNYQQIQHHLNMEKSAVDDKDRERHHREVAKVRMRRYSQQQQQPPSSSSSSSSSLLNPHVENASVDQVGSGISYYYYGVQDENDASRRQQHYHSQRRESVVGQRPVSNFYEYESVETVLRSGGGENNNHSLPRRPPPPPLQNHHNNNNNNFSNNNNLLNDNYQGMQHMAGHHHSKHHNHSHHHLRQPQPQPQHHMPSNHSGVARKVHGPFVSHVTIRECQQQQQQPKV